MDLRKVPVDSLKPWKDNPRDMSAEDAERLRKQIIMLGVYKPLLVVEEEGMFLVLGGNMRTKIFKELGISEIEVSVVNAPTQADKIKYALSDNDRAGCYDQKKLAKLIRDERKNIETADYKIEAGWLFPLADVVKLFDENETGSKINMARPDFKDIVEKFDKGETGKAKENGNWFYVEYYDDKEMFENIFAILKRLGMMKGKHEIDRNFFASLLVAKPHPVAAVEVEESINDELAFIHGKLKEEEKMEEEAEKDLTPPTKDIFPNNITPMPPHDILELPEDELCNQEPEDQLNPEEEE